MQLKMDKIPIALIVVIVILAFIGGYFTGLLNSAGNFTLNVTNKTDDSGNNYDKDYNYKETYKPVTYNKTPVKTQNNTPTPEKKPKPPQPSNETVP